MSAQPRPVHESSVQTRGRTFARVGAAAVGADDVLEHGVQSLEVYLETGS